MCAQLVTVIYKDQQGRRRKVQAILEDISPHGACVQLETAVAENIPISILYPSGRLHGQVRYCQFRASGYFVGIEFDGGYRWSRRQFKPEHLLQISLRPEKDD